MTYEKGKYYKVTLRLPSGRKIIIYGWHAESSPIKGYNSCTHKFWVCHPPLGDKRLYTIGSEEIVESTEIDEVLEI